MDTYGLTIAAQPAQEPVTLREALDYCEIEHDADDRKLAHFIARARGTFERVTERTPITTRYTLHLDDWPSDGIVRLPRSPLQAVESIAYYDAAGEDQELDEDEYLVATGGNVGRIEPATAWPATDGRLGGIRITFTAGHGDNPADVPEEIRGLILQAVGYLHRYREQADEDLLEQLFARHWSGAL